MFWNKKGGVVKGAQLYKLTIEDFKEIEDYSKIRKSKFILHLGKTIEVNRTIELLGIRVTLSLVGDTLVNTWYFANIPESKTSYLEWENIPDEIKPKLNKLRDKFITELKLTLEKADVEKAELKKAKKKLLIDAWNKFLEDNEN